MGRNLWKPTGNLLTDAATIPKSRCKVVRLNPASAATPQSVDAAIAALKQRLLDYAERNETKAA